MLEKLIRYRNFDGSEVEETFCFHLSKAEIAEMELSHAGGFAEYLRTIATKQDGKAIVQAFKDIIAKTIGRRSEDGKRFIKSAEITQEFMQTGAYDELFVQLATDTDAAIQFMNGVVPKDMQEAVAASSGTALQRPINTQEIPFPGLEGSGMTVLVDEVPVERDPLDPRSYTRQQLLDMPQDYFDAIVGTDPKKMDRDILGIAIIRRTRK